MTQRSKKPTLTTAPDRPVAKRAAVPVRDSMEDMKTHVFDPSAPPFGGAAGRASPAVDPSAPPFGGAAGSAADPGDVRTDATPIRVISMKTPGVAAREAPAPRGIPQVKLRAMSELKPPAPAPHFGHLAPPLDRREVRGRRARDLMIWGALAMILASAIAVAVWFLAR